MVMAVRVLGCVDRDSLVPTGILWERERAQENLLKQERDGVVHGYGEDSSEGANSCCYVEGCKSKEEEEEEPPSRKHKVHVTPW
jgi:hypothetical protein